MSNPMPADPTPEVDSSSEQCWAPVSPSVQVPTPTDASESTAPAPPQPQAPPQPYAPPPEAASGSNPYASLQAPARAAPRADSATPYPPPGDKGLAPYQSAKPQDHQPSSPLSMPAQQPPSSLPGMHPSPPLPGVLPPPPVNAGQIPAPVAKPSLLLRLGLPIGAGVIVIGIVIALIVSLFRVGGDIASTTTNSQSTPASSFPQIGYAGTKEQTGRPSSTWTQGASIAWTLEASDPKGYVNPAYAARGNQLVVIDNSGKTGPILSSYDMSGGMPALQWEVTDTYVYGINGNHIFWWGDYIVTASALFDATSGTKLEGDISDYSQFAIADDILIACRHENECSGWASPTERLWEKTLKFDGLATTMSVSDGDTQWLMFRDIPSHTQLLVNVRTGDESHLAVSASVALEGWTGPLIVASDGWGVVDETSKTVSFMSADGTLIDTVTATDKLYEHVARPVINTSRPTVAQLIAEARSHDLSWAESTYSFVGTDCEYLQIGPRKSTIPDHPLISRGFDDDCTSLLGRVNSAEDDSIVIAETDGLIGPFFMFDMFKGKAIDTTRYGELEAPLLAYDDLIIARSETGLVALTPTH